MPTEIFNERMNTSVHDTGAIRAYVRLKFKSYGQCRPALTRDLLGNLYAVPDWIRVPEGTLLEDLEYMRDQEEPETFCPRTQTVTSTDGTRTYTLTELKNGSIGCDCIGHMYRKKCKHTKQWSFANE